MNTRAAALNRSSALSEKAIGRIKNVSIEAFSAIGNLDSPRISIIIPTFMEEKILTARFGVFKNLLKEQYNIEIIVSDGGSSDKTVDLAKDFADIIVRHNSNTRQTIAGGRNLGAKAARGEILVFINADSIPEDINSFLEFVNDWAEGNNRFSECGALATYVTSFPEESKFKDKLFYTLHNNYVAFLNSIGLGMGRGECQIIKRQVFERVGGYNDTIVAGEDFDLYMRISKIAKVGFAKELRIYESPRRFRKYGYFRVVTSWMLNSLSVLLFKRSISKEWEAVR